MLLFGAVGIAFAPVFVRLSEVGPVSTAFWRIALAFPILFVLEWGQQKLDRCSKSAAIGRRISMVDRGFLIGAGLFFAGDLAAWHWSITLTSVANATLLANFAPIFVTLFGWLLFRDSFNRVFLAGLALAMCGAILLFSSSISVSVDHVWGDVLGVVTAVFYASYLLSVSRLRARFSTASIMLWSGVGSAFGLLPMALLTCETFWPTAIQGWMVLAALAIISHCFGQGLIAYALAHLPAAFSSVSLLLQPAIAAFLAWLLLNEAVGPMQALGAGVILLGIVVARRGAIGAV